MGQQSRVKESEVPFEELSEMEQHKQMDIANMKKIHAALMAYKKETDLASTGAIPAPPGVVGRGKPKVDIDAEMARRGHAEVIHRVVVR